MEFSQEKYNIYVLYATKPFIHDKMGGAAINEINKMSALINVHDVYYNDIYIWANYPSPQDGGAGKGEGGACGGGGLPPQAGQPRGVYPSAAPQWRRHLA